MITKRFLVLDLEVLLESTVFREGPHAQMLPHVYKLLASFRSLDIANDKSRTFSKRRRQQGKEGSMLNVNT